jgi:hypothetical protein
MYEGCGHLGRVIFWTPPNAAALGALKGRTPLRGYISDACVRSAEPRTQGGVLLLLGGLVLMLANFFQHLFGIAAGGLGASVTLTCQPL